MSNVVFWHLCDCLISVMILKYLLGTIALL
jgi:hypothetical protein